MTLDKKKQLYLQLLFCLEGELLLWDNPETRIGFINAFHIDFNYEWDELYQYGPVVSNYLNPGMKKRIDIVIEILTKLYEKQTI